MLFASRSATVHAGRYAGQHNHGAQHGELPFAGARIRTHSGHNRSEAAIDQIHEIAQDLLAGRTRFFRMKLYAHEIFA